jgi:hypothetical protein
MIVLAYVGSQCTKFQGAGWRCRFLCPFIWNHVSGLMWFCDRSDRGTASNFVQISERVWRRPWQWLDKCPGKKAWDRWKAKSRACSLFPFTSMRLFTKSSSLQAKQSILHTTVMFYSNCMKMCEDCHELWLHKNWLLHHDNTLSPLPFSPGNFWPKTTWLSFPTHPTFLCLPKWR